MYNPAVQGELSDDDFEPQLEILPWNSFRIGVIGERGCGKSTLIQKLFRNIHNYVNLAQNSQKQYPDEDYKDSEWIDAGYDIYLMYIAPKVYVIEAIGFHIDNQKIIVDPIIDQMDIVLIVTDHPSTNNLAQLYKQIRRKKGDFVFVVLSKTENLDELGDGVVQEVVEQLVNDLSYIVPKYSALVFPTGIRRNENKSVSGFFGSCGLMTELYDLVCDKIHKLQLSIKHRDPDIWIRPDISMLFGRKMDESIIEILKGFYEIFKYAHLTYENILHLVYVMNNERRSGNEVYIPTCSLCYTAYCVYKICICRKCACIGPVCETCSAESRCFACSSCKTLAEVHLDMICASPRCENPSEFVLLPCGHCTCMEHTLEAEVCEDGVPIETWRVPLNYSRFQQKA